MARKNNTKVLKQQEDEKLNLDDIFQVLGHPIRRRIIEILRKWDNLTYSELLRMLNIGDHGKLGFHIRALTGLIRREPLTKKYILTDRGLLVSDLIWKIERLGLKDRLDLADQPSIYVRSLGFGDHAFLLYNADDTKLRIAMSFLEAGLLRKEAGVYLAPEQTLDSVAREIGLESRLDHHAKGSLSIMSADEWYLKKGNAEAD